jgi:hypothetical protein
VVILNMDDGVRPSQHEFDRVSHRSFKSWSACSKAAHTTSLLPYQCIDLIPLLRRVPAFLGHGLLSENESFPFSCQTRESCGQYGLLVSGHSSWRTSDGTCNTEPRIFPSQLLLAVSHPVKLQFSDRAPLVEWPGVQGVSGNSQGNYIAPLFLAWAYILSARWAELLRLSPNHICGQRYIDGVDQNNLAEFEIGYEIDEDETSWWKALLSFGWEITAEYNGKTYLSPWSVSGDTESVKQNKNTPLANSNPPPHRLALGYVTRFCEHYGIYDQFIASLSAALYIPSLNGQGVSLPIPLNSAAQRRYTPTTLNSNLFSEQSKFLPYYMTLSCNVFGMRSLLCSTFFDINIECNLVSAWLEPAFSIIDPIIKDEDFPKLAILLAKRGRRLAPLWLGAIIVGMAKSVLRAVHTGMTALELHAAAWTSTPETFITASPEHVDGKTMLRADECRLLFILGCEGYTRPPLFPWKPFGKTQLTDTELSVQQHAHCNCHCLEYLSWHWDSSDGSTLEDTGINPQLEQKNSEELELDTIPESYSFDRSESLSEGATRGIFSWLRSNGYPAAENFIHQHSWFDMDSSDGEEINSESDDPDEYKKTASTERWVMRTDSDENETA